MPAPAVVCVMNKLVLEQRDLSTAESVTPAMLRTHAFQKGNIAKTANALSNRNRHLLAVGKHHSSGAALQLSSAHPRTSDPAPCFTT